MKTVWKFKLEVLTVQNVDMPAGAKILCVNPQDGEVALWAEVDTNAKKTPRRIEIYGTGHEMHEDIGVERVYIGTFFLRGGLLVFHVYERV